jgi:4-hydroxybenzoate polyprenyltransferase
MDSKADRDKGVFRVKDWWWSKAALLMGMIYLFAAWYHISLARFIPLSILSLITICGFASMGYLFNDLFDIKKDAAAGKSNFLAGKPVLFILLLFLVSSGFVFGPWWFLPKDNFSYLLIAAQIFLFIVYSVPPLRLKERGVAGIITDALYAHGLPPVLAAYTFALAAQHPFRISEIGMLFIWQTTSGIRNILLHQFDDLESDKISGSKNFVAGMDLVWFGYLLRALVIAEVLLSVAFFEMLVSVNPLFIIAILTTVALSVAALVVYKARGQDLFSDVVWRFFPNNVTEKWLPPAFLIILSASDFRFMILLVIHLAIFNFDFYYQVGKRIYLQVKASRVFFITVKIILSYPVNYTIYYTLRIFSIDLIKERTSFVVYFKKRLGTKEAPAKTGEH